MPRSEFHSQGQAKRHSLLSPPFKGCYVAISAQGTMHVPCGKKRVKRGLCETHLAERDARAHANKRQQLVNPRRRMKTRVMLKEGISGKQYAKLRRKALRVHRRRTNTPKLRSVRKLHLRYYGA